MCLDHASVFFTTGSMQSVHTKPRPALGLPARSIDRRRTVGNPGGDEIPPMPRRVMWPMQHICMSYIGISTCRSLHVRIAPHAPALISQHGTFRHAASPPLPTPPLRSTLSLSGVAIQQAAAAAEQKNVAEAVQDARARGEIPKISELPAPWGPVHADPAPREALVGAGYYPPTYPTGSSPLVDSSA